MLFVSAEVHVKRVERCQKLAERSALRHDRKRIHILGKALAAIAEFSVGAGHVCMGVVDIRPVQPLNA